MTENISNSASFRDPSGFVFEAGGIVYRQINDCYADNYRQLIDSGLYDKLVAKRLLIAHEEIDSARGDNRAFKVIRPEKIDYISYPYEWCFSQLKDAALATLTTQTTALACGMNLKDASGFNIQFHRGKPILIDTLSFEPYLEGQPWIAYRQFCQHFLAPLLLMSYRHHSLIKMLRTHIDGIPLDVVSKLLPHRTWFRYSVLSHIHLHARAQKHYGDSGQNSKDSPAQRQVKVSRMGLLGLLDSLRSLVDSLHWQPGQTEWSDYYGATNYAEESMQHKLQLVAEYVAHSGWEKQIVMDLGANTGRFSRAIMALGHQVIAQDVDELAIERCYRQAVESGETRLLPLVQDLTNPSPSLGWAHEERQSMLARGPVDTVLALALIHHLAISNNTPLQRCAAFFAASCKRLIIEFVPKGDSQVSRLLSTREDTFDNYTRGGFEAAFGEYFELLESSAVAGSERRIYLMAKKSAEKLAGRS